MKYLLIHSSSLFLNSNNLQRKKTIFQLGVIRSLIQLKDFGYSFILIIEPNNKNKIKFLLELLVNEGINIKELVLQSKLTKELINRLQDLKSKSEFNSFLVCTNKLEINGLDIGEAFKIKTLILDINIKNNEFDKKKFKNWENITYYLLNRNRIFSVSRKTNETNIQISINLDGKGESKINTGLNFFNHMLENFSKHSQTDLTIQVVGDLEVDEHHTIEDTALVLAEVFKQALFDKRGIKRYGFVLPMDEAESYCSLDLSGRGHLEWQAELTREYVGDFPTELLHHFYYSFCINAGVTLNMKITGKNDHHKIESSFKAFAKCIKQAVTKEGIDLLSTKGSL